MKKRPDGVRLMRWSAAMLVVAVVGMILYGFVGPFGAEDPRTPVYNLVGVTLPLIFFPAGLLGWLTGYVVYAISFLPASQEVDEPRHD